MPKNGKLSKIKLLIGYIVLYKYKGSFLMKNDGVARYAGCTGVP